ncbi:MAG: adenylate kinase [Verrucomicrobia bacterium]|nr:adenylate kinase [Verrucomicrobiota bacterium]
MSGSISSAPLSAPVKTAAPAPLVLILLGPPGSGKGTQAKMLEDKMNLPHISTGDLLRDHIRRGTALGKQAQTYMDKGHLVPDGLILDMLFERVSLEDCAKGYILDGSPRTIPQAEALQQRLIGQPAPVVINLDLSDAQIIERLTKRVVCEKCGTPYHLLYSPPKTLGKCDKCSGSLIQRPDDTEAVIAKRLKVYHEQTEPLIAFYSKQKLLHTVDCTADKDTVFSMILAFIKQH